MTKKLVSYDDAVAAGARLPASVKTEIQGYGGSGDPAAATHAAASKATPVDADELPLVDSGAGFGLKRLTWANLKAAIKAYYDPLAATLTNKTISGATNTLSAIGVSSLSATGTKDTTTFLRGDNTFAVPPAGGGGITSAAIPIPFGAVTTAIGVTGSNKAGVARTLTGASLRTTTAPVGSALTVQVQHSTDGTAWSSVGSALSIAAGSTAEVTTTFTQVQSIGHLVRLNITSVGSTTAATGIAVDVTWT